MTGNRLSSYMSYNGSIPFGDDLLEDQSFRRDERGVTRLTSLKVLSDGRTTTNKSLIQALLGTFLLVQQVLILTLPDRSIHPLDWRMICS